MSTTETQPAQQKHSAKDSAQKHYAHLGAAADRGFVVRNGRGERDFLAFDTREELLAEQQRIFEPGNTRGLNLIECSRRYVAGKLGHDFVIKDGVCFKRFMEDRAPWIVPAVRPLTGDAVHDEVASVARLFNILALKHAQGRHLRTSVVATGARAAALEMVYEDKVSASTGEILAYVLDSLLRARGHRALFERLHVWKDRLALVATVQDVSELELHLRRLEEAATGATSFNHLRSLLTTWFFMS